MNLNFRQLSLSLVLIVLLAFGVFSLINYFENPELDAITLLSGGSTYVIALLTIIYVMTTSRQLDVMGRQLDEMKRDRELQHQPLPWISQTKIRIEKPQLYHSPSKPGKYNVQARYNVDITLKNIGNCPSVNIDASARIAIPMEKNVKYFDSVSESLHVLEEKREYPSSEYESLSFLFADDEEGLFFHALTETSLKKYPILMLRILYRNILGACFGVYNDYLVYLAKRPEHDVIISEWLSGMKSFPIKYKKELKSLMELEKSNLEKWDELFNILKKNFSKSLKDEDVNISAWSIPDSFEIQNISENEYTKFISDISYGSVLPDLTEPPCLEKINKNQETNA
jgi:hypothetical protein